MPKAILTKTYDGFGGKCNFKYAHLKHYDLGAGIKVRLKKETASFTRYAGWGLQAVTSIKKGFVLGYFVVKSRDAGEPEEGTYNIKTRDALPYTLSSFSVTKSRIKFLYECW